MENDSDLELIDAVYAATTEDGSLSDALQLFHTLQESPGGVIFHYDSITEESTSVEIITPDNKTHSYIQSLLDDYAGIGGKIKHPFIITSLDELKAGKIVTKDFIPSSELSKTTYYKKIFAPLGIRRTMGWMAIGRGQKWPTFTCNRTAENGEYQPHHFDRAKLFQRHLARSLHIMELLDDAAESKLILEQSIDRMPQAIVLVDDRLEIAFCNYQASKLISQSPSLSEFGNRIGVGATMHERSKFEQWWAILIQSQTSDGACFSDTPMNPVWEIEVSRLAPTSNGNIAGRRWMLTLKQAVDIEGIYVDHLTTSYGLTKSEANVCRALCSNGDAVSTARAMNISPNTVRTHLKSAFAKTNTRSQVQLAVKLISQK